MEKDTKLTPKQGEFCNQYLVDLNGKQAAIRSGYSARTAENQASRLLSNAKVQGYLAKLQSKLRLRNEITRDEVFEVLASVIRSNVSDLFEDGKLKSFDKLTSMQKKAVESIKISRTGIEVKLSSKLQAIQTINRMLGFDAAQEFNVQLQNLDETVLDALIERLIIKKP